MRWGSEEMEAKAVSREIMKGLQDHEVLPKAFKEMLSCGNGKPLKGFKPCGDKIRDFVLFF